MPNIIRLDEPRFTTPQLTRIARIPDKMFRSWGQSRRGTPPVMILGERHLTGRLVFTLAEVLQAVFLGELTRKALIGPSDAAEAVNLVVERLSGFAKDTDGHPVLDFAAIPPGLTLFLAATDSGEVVREMLDAGRGTPSRWTQETHIAMPIGPLVFRVLLDATTELEAVR